MDKKTLDVLSF